MYTKSVIDKLTEKLAEELNPEQLEELTRLCEGVYSPAVFGMPPDEYRRAVACGGAYAEECSAGQNFSEQLCLDQGRFDWGDCDAQTYSGAVHPGVVCSAQPEHAYVCSSFTCGDEEHPESFSCSAATEQPFECSENFECVNHVTCYAGYTCEEFDCEDYHGCAEGYTCPDEFECKGDAGFTCGEGEQAVDLGFRCDETDHAFGCGYIDEDEKVHGNFECRDIHNCPAHFTCFLNDTCGTSPKADSFTCGTEGAIIPSGYFYCAHRQQCTDTFQCTSYHACGNGYNDAEADVFTCGNGSGVDISAYDCNQHFTCDDVFNCKDVFHCPDYFTCGDEAIDFFTCGTGDEFDEFSCGDATPPNYFYCAGQYRCDDANDFGCGFDDYNCVDEFDCTDPSGTYTCGSETKAQYSCQGTFNCYDENLAVSFSCPALFSCYDKFKCGSPTGAASFTCGAEETLVLFTCGTDDFEHADEFGCYSPSKFKCSNIGSDVYHCPGGPSELYNCTQMYTCDDNSDYECNVNHRFTGCQNPPFKCNEGHDAVFRCTSFEYFSCQTSVEFVCSQLFACIDHVCTDTVFDCGSAGSGATQQFRCDEIYRCVNGFICQGENGFECQNIQRLDFSCNGEFSCTGVNSHRCASWFECTTTGETAFSCVGTYVCPSGVTFECSSQESNSPEFQCTGGETANFDCDSGELYDFMCGWTGSGGFSCTQSGQVEGFTCSTRHIFLCTHPPQGEEFECGTFTCRPHGVCSDIHQYGGCGTEAYSMPGDFGCPTSHDCISDFQCETPFPGDNFNCPEGGFDCSGTFGGCSPEARFSTLVSTFEGTYASMAPAHAHASLHITVEATVKDIIALIQRRSQIREDEARDFLDNTLRQYFKRTLPSDLTTRLSDYVIDLGLLIAKLGYREVDKCIGLCGAY